MLAMSECARGRVLVLFFGLAGGGRKRTFKAVGLAWSQLILTANKWNFGGSPHSNLQTRSRNRGRRIPLSRLHASVFPALIPPLPLPPAPKKKSHLSVRPEYPMRSFFE